MLTVRTNKPVEKIVVYDAVSKVVKCELINHERKVLINVSDLPNGVYIIQVHFDDHGMAVKKIIKNSRLLGSNDKIPAR